MRQILTIIFLILTAQAAAQFTPRTNINGYPRFLNAHQDTAGVLRNVGGGTGSWGRVRVGDIDTAALRSWFGPGGGSDGNNLTTGISFNNQRLTLTRSGLSALNADIDTVFLATVRSVRDSLLAIRTLIGGFLTAETDPTVSAWAKAPVKPSYTYAEISGTPTTWPWASLTGVPATFTPSAHGHVIGDVTGLQTALDGKENTIAAGTTAQYWRGDKSWQTLNTTAVAEGSNQYFTNARARLALSFTAGSGAYNSTTGLITIPTNTSQLTNSAGFITGNQTITLTGNVTGSGTTSIATTIGSNAVTNAMLATVGTGIFKGRTTAGTGNVEDLTATQATALLDNFTASLKGLVPASGGGTTNFLRADGTWAPPPGGGSGLTLLNLQTGSTQTFATGTTGTDFEIVSAANVHTFNIPNASATARGLVSTGSQTIAGQKTFLENLLVSPTGSTYSSPKILGMNDFGVGQAARWQMGDAVNAIQNGEGAKFDIYSFWSMRLVGNRNTGTPLAITNVRSPADPSVDVIGTQGTNTVLRAMGAAGQTGNLQEWSTSAGTVLASVSSAGVVSAPAVAIAGTQSITGGSSATVSANVFRVVFDPAANLESFTLTLPAAPVDGQIVQVWAGGTIASGAVVSTSFTVSPNAGQTLFAAITPTSINGGDIMEFAYSSSNTRWTRTK